MFQIKEAGTESGTAERRADSGVLQISLLAYPELGDVKRTYSMSASHNNNEEPHVSHMRAEMASCREPRISSALRNLSH